MATRSPSAGVAPPVPFPPAVRDGWMLDRTITFLNHGCFGARLREVYAAQQVWREQYEATPVAVLDRHRGAMIDEAKAVVGPFLGMEPANFGFVTNATGGVNAVLRSLRFEAGDEIVTTQHVYNAVRQTMRWLAERAGATASEIRVPFPCAGPDAVIEAVERAVGARTRLVVIDHVSSPTALRFPIEAIIAMLHERGVPVLIDGAHAPGMLDLDVESLGADYYTGNLHKWVGAPSGAAFLWVNPDVTSSIHPPVISHFLGEGMAAEFEWQGTRDISPWIVGAEAIRQMDALDGPESWPRIRAHNHALAIWTARHLAERCGLEPTSPRDGSMLGSMVAMLLPETLRTRFGSAVDLHDMLYDEHRIEVPIFEWDGHWIVRPSLQVYNTPDDIDRLASVVAGLT